LRSLLIMGGACAFVAQLTKQRTSRKLYNLANEITRNAAQYRKMRGAAGKLANNENPLTVLSNGRWSNLSQKLLLLLKHTAAKQQSRSRYCNLIFTYLN
jgi:hypothetical protein